MKKNKKNNNLRMIRKHKPEINLSNGSKKGKNNLKIEESKINNLKMNIMKILRESSHQAILGKESFKMLKLMQIITLAK